MTLPILVRLLLLISLALVESPCLLTQTNSALDYYPLHTGDLRQYFYHVTWYTCPPTPPTVHTDSSYHIERVLGDTVLSTGRTYKITQSDLPIVGSTHYRRIDTLSANVYELVDGPSPREALTDSLLANPGDVFAAGARECIGIDTSIVLGTLRIRKYFVYNIIPNQYYSLAYGLGLVSLNTSQDDACYNAVDSMSLSLNYASFGDSEFGTLTSSPALTTQLPRSFRLAQNFPNPFNPVTTIQYDLPTEVHVDLKLYDVLGREVASLVNAFQGPGHKTIMVDASQFASGVYFYRLISGDFVDTKHMVLLK